MVDVGWNDGTAVRHLNGGSLRAIQNFIATASLTAGQVVRLDSTNASFAVGIYDVDASSRRKMLPYQAKLTPAIPSRLTRSAADLGKARRSSCPEKPARLISCQLAARYPKME
jgi:hypothetical protein